MMKFTVLCIFAVVALAASKPQEKYTDRYDTINVGEILDNKRLFDAYVDCILENVRCTNEAKELKSHVQDALENKCSKCTKVQYDTSRSVIAHLINKKPAVWDKLKAKYDPSGKYVHMYEKELKTIAKA